MKKRVAISQSNYIPWRGYFDLLDDVEFFVIYDDVQYTKNDWRNRNRIKTPAGARWLSVPVRHSFLGQTIDAVEIASDQPWRRVHREAIRANYGRAAFFESLSPGLFAVLDEPATRLSDLNLALIRWAMDLLEIRTQLIDVRDLSSGGHRSERLIGIVKELGGDHYLSGPSAAAYLDVEAFRTAGIELAYKSYLYEPYPQLWGAFTGDVSVIDLLFNMGPGAREKLKSLGVNERVA